MLLNRKKYAVHASCRSLLVFIFLLGGVITPAIAQTTGGVASDNPSQHILVLYSYGYGGRGVETFTGGFLSAMTAHDIAVNDLYFEYLDLERNKDTEYRSQLVQSLGRKYAQREIGLIVTVQQPALDFLLGDGQAIAPGKPVVSVQAQVPTAASSAGRHIVSRLTHFDIKGTLERAIQLFPETQHVLFVSGSSPADRRMADESAKAAARWGDKLTFEYTTDRSLKEILQRSHNLPPHSVIIFVQFNHCCPVN